MFKHLFLIDQHNNDFKIILGSGKKVLYVEFSYYPWYSSFSLGRVVWFKNGKEINEPKSFCRDELEVFLERQYLD
jgi:hypothetical protein